jgi:hypothetical protein
MPSIQEMLKQRQEAIKSAQAAGAVPGKATSETSAGIGLSTIAVGLQGSQESAGLLSVAPDNKIVAVMDKEKAAAALGVFAATHLRKYTRKGGIWVRPQNGYYYAQDQQDLITLRHHASEGRVEEITLSAEK